MGGWSASVSDAAYGGVVPLVIGDGVVEGVGASVVGGYCGLLGVVRCLAGGFQKTGALGSRGNSKM